MEENWYPSEDEYNPGITKEQWKEFVTDRNVFTEDSLIAFACIQRATLATCTDMAEEFGRTKNFYNNAIWRTGEKVHKLTNCPLSLSPDKTERFWSICCLGRKMQNGRIELKIRPELEEAFDETGVLKGIEVMENENRNYYVISPNVWNDNNFDYLLDYMIQNHCVLMGWQTDNPKGKLFSNLKTGDCIVVALRRSWKFNYYFIGTLSSDSIEEYDDAQKRSLENFTLLEDKNCDFLKTWSAAGSSQIPAIAKIDKIKNPEIISAINDILNGENIMPDNSLSDNLTELLKHTHNLILHGAPGTGKTFLAKQIAEKMGCSQNEIGFVQFHPSYDYTDFVEGLRPKNQSGGEIGFERKDGIFKEFCKRALQNLIDSKKSVEVLEKEISINDKVENFLEKAIEEKSEFETATGNKFTIIENTEKNIFVSIPANEKTSELSLPKNDLIQLLNSENKIESGADIKSFFNRKWRTQQDSYIWILYKEINSLKQNVSVQKIEKIQEKNFLFIIDEINRGELSKIFGELFFCIDPGYRGKNGMIKTQYQNLIENGDEFYDGFFIPENVYIIGTMNDIDRSVDTMDFAFRRRFAFKEIKASENLGMLDELDEIADEAKARLIKLNEEISKITELSSPSSYHIGGAYFLKLKDFEGDSNERFQKLWGYHLEGLLKEYLRGTENAEGNFKKLRGAYFLNKNEEESKDFS
ncbi:MAG: AAA family ATPase [Spirochaetales bacterium]|nr:AAA family ATPase [Spirochaetales bacterium]